MGLIDLTAYPMKTWSEIMPNEEKVEVEGKQVDLKDIPVRYYNGKLMLLLKSLLNLR